MLQQLNLPGLWDVIDSETISDLTSSTSLNATKAAAADAVIVSIFGGAAVIRMDGTAVTTTTGIVVAADAYELLNVKDLTDVRIIEQDSGEAATAFVHYLKHRGSNN